MSVLGDDGLDLIAVRGKQAAVLTRTCGPVGVFGLHMRQVPDAIIHAFGIVVDESNFLR